MRRVMMSVFLMLAMGCATMGTVGVNTSSHGIWYQDCGVSRQIPSGTATFRGTLTSPNSAVDSAVALGGVGEDGGRCGRVLSRRGVGLALGRKHGGQSLQAGAELPFFLSAEYLRPFVSDELRLVLSRPIMYRGSGGVAYGVPAETLPQIFDVWLQARDAGVLNSATDWRG